MKPTAFDLLPPEAPEISPEERLRKLKGEGTQSPAKAPRQRRAHKTPAQGVKARHEPAKASHPWESIVDEKAPEPVRLVNFKCPPDIFKELHWFAETTYGYTMTRILLEGARMKLDEMRKAKGIE